MVGYEDWVANAVYDAADDRDGAKGERMKPSALYKFLPEVVLGFALMYDLEGEVAKAWGMVRLLD